MFPAAFTSIFALGFPAHFREDITPDSSMDSNAEQAFMHRFKVRQFSRSVEVWMMLDNGRLVSCANAKRSVLDDCLTMDLCAPRASLAVSEVELKRAIACIASVCGLTTGKEVWRVLPENRIEVIEFAIHRKGGIQLFEDLDQRCAVSLFLRGRRLTNRNKKLPPSPDEVFVFEAKTPKKENRHDSVGLRYGSDAEPYAHPFIAVLKELYRQAKTGTIALQDCIVPWRGGPSGEPNGRLECYDLKEPQRVFCPVLCFAVDEGATQPQRA
jgi:hypothetical protein